jgi:hypothetical protein
MAWKLLFGSDVGQMSLISALVVIAIGVYLCLFFNRKMAGDENRESQG